MAANLTFTNLRDKVLLWLHGRRLGIFGDGQGSSLLVLDGVAVASSRTGAASFQAVAAGSNGVGAITVAGAQVGDNVQFVLNLTGDTDVTSSYESTVSVAGQVQQTSASNLSGNTNLFFIQPQK